MLRWLGGDRGGGTPVTLHIYDLGPSFAGPNMVGRAIGTGAFHAGVEVYGSEWSFSCGQDGPYRSGIFRVPPRGCDAHVYREAVEMGETTMNARDVKQLIERLYREWPGGHYDLLRRNCCHFSDELCMRLGVGPIPAWVTSLAGVGAMLRSGIRLAVEGAAAAPGAVVVGVSAAPAFLLDAAAAVGGAAAALGGAFVRDAGIIKAIEQGPTVGHSRVPTPQRPGSSEKPELRRGVTQGLPRGKEESRARESTLSRSDDGQWAVGDLLEVWSNSHKAWCAGRVEALRPDSMVAVSFKLPVDGSDNLASKLLPADHQHLRRAPVQGNGFAKGDAVEVFSNSQQAWCLGHVEQVQGQMLYLAFRLPGAKADEWSQKQLPFEHKDVRRASPPGPTSSGNSTGAASPVSSTAAAPPQRAPPASTAREAAAAKLAAAVRAGDVAAIEEACGAAEAAGVSASEVDAARLTAVTQAAKEELEAARRSCDACWIEQACRRAKDAGLPSAAIEPARVDARRLNARTDLAQAIRCGDAELIEEASQLAEAVGVPAAELEAARREAKAIRAREAEAAKAADAAAGGKGEAPPALGTRQIHASEVVVLAGIGDWVEVYSNSHQAWCLARITKVTPEGKTVVFQLPGAKPDEWNEKMVPAGCNGVLRRPAAAAERRMPPAWSPEEGAAYGRAFRELSAPGDGAASPGAGSTAAKANADNAAEYLKGSGLPRKVLKQIWMVANPQSAQELSPTEFAMCLRLVGHCQAVLASGDCAAAEVLADGGEVLKSIMEGELLHKPPPTLPRFHGQLLEGRSPTVHEVIQV